MFGHRRRRFPRHIRQSIGFLLILGGFLAGIAALYFIYDRFAITLAHKPGYLTSNIKLMAIMPIENYDNDERATQWSDSLTMRLTELLSRHKIIHLIDHRSIKRMQNFSSAREDWFRKLQVEYILTGGVMRLDDQVVVTLHLYEARSGESIWAQSFAALWSDNASFLVQLSETVYNQLNERFFPHVKRLVEEGAAKKRKLPDGRALKIYYEAKKLLERDTEQSNMMALLLLHQALKIQDDLAPAHSLLAELQYRQNLSAAQYRDAQWQEINEKLDATLALDGEQGIPYALKADIAFKFRRNMPVTDIYYQQALRFDPSNSDIRFAYARFLVAVGRFFDAQKQVFAGQRLNPLAYPILEAVWVYTMSGEYQLAEKELEKLTPIKPVTPDYYIAAQQLYQSRGDEYQAYGQYLNIFKHLNFAKEDIGGAIKAYEKDGLAGLNLWLALEKQEQLDIGQYLPPLSTAYYLAAAGEPDQAMEYLALALQAGQLGLLWAKSDPRFAELHGRPEFIELMKKVGFLYFDEV